MGINCNCFNTEHEHEYKFNFTGENFAYKKIVCLSKLNLCIYSLYRKMKKKKFFMVKRMNMIKMLLIKLIKLII